MLQITCSSITRLTFYANADPFPFSTNIQEHQTICYSLEDLKDVWQVVFYTKAYYPYNIYYIEGNEIQNLTLRNEPELIYGFSKSKGMIAIENLYMFQRFTGSFFGFYAGKDEKVGTIVSLIDNDIYTVQSNHTTDLENKHSHYNYLSLVDHSDILINSLEKSQVNAYFTEYDQYFKRETKILDFNTKYEYIGYFSVSLEYKSNQTAGFQFRRYGENDKGLRLVMFPTENQTIFYPANQTAIDHKLYGGYHFHWEYIIYFVIGYYAFCFLLFIPIGILAKVHPNRYYRSGMSCQCCYKSCIKEYFAAEKHYKNHPTTCIYCATCCKNPFDIIFMQTKQGTVFLMDMLCRIWVIPVMYAFIWVVFLLFVEIHVLINLCMRCNAEEADFESNYNPKSEITVPLSETPTYAINQENIARQGLIDNPYQ
ncbi:hypothetical protein TVAG_087580 [Trichomonas vaginalis G3]|uniref:Uncharacterized protein n=1 Tax=Trichomonas vaginalis (strain ATCC PRA-98 / G3) TaxID=412133 RepID=A2FDT4_TRIV3|nr:hypothetical protein TVAGG3_0371240 [Trichomonas vaginalis G3]EAX96933.1 hypothetical protein TVAG_087580 [Trichomonas vaginalis G3]KAI5532620.1 hypothetical protein TVAGG3_0371240 [Trichomonas vaginalis G3]|eukprot:XP_001309863.1 hypothetical protein [Trichomonas vaginalis G3]